MRAQELHNPNPPENDQELARHLLERGVGLFDEEEPEVADPDDVAPIPRPPPEPDTDAFNRRINHRVDRTYIGQLVDIEREFFQRQRTAEEREERF